MRRTFLPVGIAIVVIVVGTHLAARQGGVKPLLTRTGHDLPVTLPAPSIRSSRRSTRRTCRGWRRHGRSQASGPSRRRSSSPASCTHRRPAACGARCRCGHVDLALRHGSSAGRCPRRRARRAWAWCGCRWWTRSGPGERRYSQDGEPAPAPAAAVAERGGSATRTPVRQQRACRGAPGEARDVAVPHRRRLASGVLLEPRPGALAR